MTMSQENEATVIQTTSLARLYGTALGLAGVDLEIGSGVVGLLGPNGAGKTTLLRLISGLDRPTRGEVRVLGEDPFDNPSLRRKVGFAPDGEVLWPDLTGLETMLLLLRLDGLSRTESRDRADELLEQVGLPAAPGGPARRKVGGYSKGMKQRLKLAIAIANRPRLLLLDEPQDGLDPAGRHELHERIRQLAAEGCTVVLSSHVLHEVEAVADSVILMRRGRVLVRSPVAKLRALCAERPLVVRLDVEDARATIALLAAWPQVRHLEIESPTRLVVSVRPWEAFFERLTEQAAMGVLEPRSVEPLDDSLEAVFDYVVHGYDEKVLW